MNKNKGDELYIKSIVMLQCELVVGERVMAVYRSGLSLRGNTWLIFALEALPGKGSETDLL